MTYSGQWGQFHPPLIDVRIEQVENPQCAVTVRGLIDTGATLSMISSDVAQALGLFPRQFKSVNTIERKVVMPFHVVRLVMDSKEPLRPRGVIELPPGGLGGERTMLLGRDILKYGMFRMGPSWFDLSLHPDQTG